MTIIVDLINASRKAIMEAIEAGNAAAIQKVATDQVVTDKPCAIDSLDPVTIKAALSVHKGAPMINSISLLTMAIAKGLDGASIRRLAA